MILFPSKVHLQSLSRYVKVGTTACERIDLAIKLQKANECNWHINVDHVQFILKVDYGKRKEKGLRHNSRGGVENVNFYCVTWLQGLAGVDKTKLRVVSHKLENLFALKSDFYDGKFRLSRKNFNDRRKKFISFLCTNNGEQQTSSYMVSERIIKRIAGEEITSCTAIVNSALTKNFFSPLFCCSLFWVETGNGKSLP